MALKPDLAKGKPYKEVLKTWTKAAQDLQAVILGFAEEPCVIALNGGWGTGKTTFLHAFAEQLRDKPHEKRVIYFDAWQEDHAQDPRVSLIGELLAALDNNEKDLGQRLLKAVGAYVRVGAPIAARAAFRKLIGLKDEEMEQIAEEAAGDSHARVFEQAVADHAAARRSFEALKTAITEAAASVPAPLVFIIDELDRCRPTYAIELPETVKHLFDTPGVVFVLGVDLDQLHEAVRVVYGKHIRTPGYLRRFIDLEYVFEPPSVNQLVTAHLRHFQEQKELEGISKLYVMLAPLWSVGARDAARYVATLRVVQARHRQIPNASRLGVMLFFKLFEPALYESIALGRASTTDYLRLFLTPARRSLSYRKQDGHWNRGIGAQRVRRKGTGIGDDPCPISGSVRQASG